MPNLKGLRKPEKMRTLLACPKTAFSLTSTLTIGPTKMEKELKIDELTVRIYANQSAMAKAVTEDVHAYIAAQLQAQDSLAAILATGNSQIEFLQALNQKGGLIGAKRPFSIWMNTSVLRATIKLASNAT